jgi:hypothetical protein
MNKIISYKEFLNESKSAIVTEANQEEQIKKEVISKLSDFFGCAPGNLSKFNFDGKDNIKELTKALRSTSDEGTAQYYRVAILMAKRDLGIHESEEVINEAKKKITIKFTKSNQSEVSSYVFSRLENDKLVDTGKNGPDYMDLKFDSKNYDKVIDTLRRCDAIDSIDESVVNEGFNNYGWFLRLPKKVISNELRSATKNLTSYYNDASSGSDLQQDVLEDIISELETVKDQLKKFSKGEKPTGVYESEEVNEKLDTKYWADYNDQNSPQSTPEFAEKSTDFEDTFEDAVEEWNNEADSAENQIKGAQIQKIKKMAMEFFKIEKWISVNVVQAMIMQES